MCLMVCATSISLLKFPWWFIGNCFQLAGFLDVAGLLSNIPRMIADSTPHFSIIRMQLMYSVDYMIPNGFSLHAGSTI